MSPLALLTSAPFASSPLPGHEGLPRSQGRGSGLSPCPQPQSLTLPQGAGGFPALGRTRTRIPRPGPGTGRTSAPRGRLHSGLFAYPASPLPARAQSPPPRTKLRHVRAAPTANGKRRRRGSAPCSRRRGPGGGAGRGGPAHPHGRAGRARTANPPSGGTNPPGSGRDTPPTPAPKPLRAEGLSPQEPA